MWRAVVVVLLLVVGRSSFAPSWYIQLQTSDVSWVEAHRSSKPCEYSWDGNSWSGWDTSLTWAGGGIYQSDPIYVTQSGNLYFRLRDIYSGSPGTVLGTWGPFAVVGGGPVQSLVAYAFGGTPPTTATRKWSHSVTNQSVLAETYRLKLDFATGEDVERELTLLPGATLNLNVEDFRDFTVTLERMQPLPDKMGMGWIAEVGLPAVTSGNQATGWTPPPPTSQAGPGNVWTDGNRGALGTMPDLSVTPQTRSNDYSDTTKAVKTGDDNAQARHAELSALLVASDRRATERANVELATLGAGLERLRQAVITEGEANRAAVTNLDGHLTGDGMTKTLPIGIEGEGLTAGADDFAGWWVPPSVGKTAPQVTLPLSLASDQLADATLDLGDSRAADWVATVRAFVLLAVSGGFLLASFQLVGRAAGV